MKRYSVRLGSGSMLLTEADIAVLFRSGGVKTDTPCSEVGKDWWRTVDELFPLMKHEGRPSMRDDPYPAVRNDARQTSAMLAGWICFGIGASVSWFFPLGYIFFSVALVMAIVAMATHEVSRGVILLLSSFVAMGISAVISFLLAVGLFAAAAGHVISKVESEAAKQRKPVPAATLFPIAVTGRHQANPTDDLTEQINQINQLTNQLTRSSSRPAVTYGGTPVVTPRPISQATPAAVKPTIDTSVEAQLQRIRQQEQARKNYQSHADALRRQIDYYQKLGRGSRGTSREFMEKQVDALRKQLQELNNKNLGM